MAEQDADLLWCMYIEKGICWNVTLTAVLQSRQNALPSGR